MAKQFFSLGFWMTIVLFISLSYVFAAEVPSPTTYEAEEQTIQGPLVPREEAPNYVDETNTYSAGAEDRDRRGCPSDEGSNKFPPSYSAERRELRFAPGLTFTLGDKPSRMSSLCAGPVEIPRS
jgi:hypothetical protein